MPAKKAAPLFDTVAIIGIGLMGSSVARALRKYKLARHIVCADKSAAHRATAKKLKVVDEAFASNKRAVQGADLVVLAVPVGLYETIAREIAPALQEGCIVSDLGSVKAAVVAALTPHLPAHAHLVPGHPIAGAEVSGPEHGYAELFANRWCILTPPPKTNKAAVRKVVKLWQAMGSKVEQMSAAHHDRVLALTSHLPHFLSYTIMGMGADLEAENNEKLMTYSAGSFRDFTRTASSNAVMWRDIFLTNREALLDIVARLNSDMQHLEALVKAGDGEAMHAFFTRARSIRKTVFGTE